MRTFNFRLLLIAAIAVFGLPSASQALASLDIVFVTLTSAGPTCGAGRNDGTVILGRAEGIGFGNSNSVCALEGDTIFGRILMNVSDEGAAGNTDDVEIAFFQFSLAFDEASGTPIDANGDFGNFQNELNLLAAHEINAGVKQGGAITLTPLNQGVLSTQESVLGVQRGDAIGYESGTLGAGLRSGASPYIIGNFTLYVTANGISDGRDVFAGFFTGSDLFLNGDNTVQAGGTPTVGADVNSLVFVPEPGTAALMGLGLLGAVGLARRGARRKS